LQACQQLFAWGPHGDTSQAIQNEKQTDKPIERVNESDLVDAGAACQQKQNLENVKISAWKLAKLNAEQAVEARANARRRSSVLKQLWPHDSGGGAHLTDCSTSSNLSSRSSSSAGHGLKDVLHSSREEVITVMDLPHPLMTGRESESLCLAADTVEVGSKSPQNPNSDNATCTLPHLISTSILPSERYVLLDQSESFAADGARGAPLEPMHSASISTVPVMTTTSSAYQGVLLSDHNPMQETGAVTSHSSKGVSRDGADASVQIETGRSLHYQGQNMSDKDVKRTSDSGKLSGLDTVEEDMSRRPACKPEIAISTDTSTSAFASDQIHHYGERLETSVLLSTSSDADLVSYELDLSQLCASRSNTSILLELSARVNSSSDHSIPAVAH
jgi:hypothetical protein